MRSQPKSISTPFRRRAPPAALEPAFTPPALQAISRDFAFIVPAGVTADALVRAVRGTDKSAITGVLLFDRFETPEALAWRSRSRFSRPSKSFTDEQIGEISSRIVAAAEKLGARLRS